MALSSFGRGREGDPGTGVPPNAGPGAAGGLTAFIDQGSEFEGKLAFKDTVRIDGRFRGEITSENTLIIGESGEIEATIHSKTVVISGTVMGNVHASQKVVLHKTARVDGDLETASLVVEEGAFVTGQIRMKARDGKQGGAKPLKAIDGGGATEKGDAGPPSKSGPAKS